MPDRAGNPIVQPQRVPEALAGELINELEGQERYESDARRGLDRLCL